MELYSKSAITQNYLPNTAPADNILQKRKIAQRHAHGQSQNLKANITRITTTKPHRGVCVGLSSTFQSLLKLILMILLIIN